MKTMDIQQGVFPGTSTAALPGLRTAPREPVTLIHNRRSPAEIFGECRTLTVLFSVMLLAIAFFIRFCIIEQRLSLFGGFFCAATVLISAGIVHTVVEKDFRLIWNPSALALRVDTYFLGMRCRAESIPLERMRCIVITYRHCAQCGAVFGRRYPKDPEISLELSDGRTMFCGEYDLEPVEEFIRTLGYYGILEEVDLRHTHTKMPTLCATCSLANTIK